MKSSTTSRPQPESEVVVDDPCFWYFYTELLLSFELKSENLRSHLDMARISPEKSQAAVQVHSTSCDLERRALAFFNIFTREEMEDLVSAVLVSNGFSYSTPDSRRKMGMKMINSVRAGLVTELQKIDFAARFMDSVINRMIERE